MNEIYIYTRKNVTICQRDVFTTVLQQAFIVTNNILIFYRFYNAATCNFSAVFNKGVELQDDGKLLKKLATVVLNNLVASSANKS